MAATGSAAPLEGFASRPVWHLPLARGGVALAIGIVVTFVQSHAAAVGLVAFSVLAVLSGVIMLVLRRSVPDAVRGWPLTAGVVGVVAGVAAVVVAGVVPTADGLALVVATWGALTAAAEGVAAWRMRGVPDPSQRRIVRDWRSVAILTGVAAIVFAVLPRNEVVLVGLLGAYAAIVGVYLVIAALSARPSRREQAPEADAA